MNNIVTTTINVSELQSGMTVRYKGEILTVSKHDIKYNELFGYSFRGDGSKQTIERIQFAVPTAFGISLR